MTDERPPADVLVRLAIYADHVDQLDADEIKAILIEAAETIQTLRMLVGIKEDIWLEDIPPEGNA